MKVSLQWLNEILHGNVSPEEIDRILSGIGFDVENISSHADQIKGVVVAEIKGVTEHPHADHLSLCSIFDGSSEKNIVCGAPNVKAGMKVPFAPVSAALPGGLVVRKAKIRGIDSPGMICSEKELALSDESKGIMELPSSMKTGSDFCAAMGLHDSVIEFEVTPNRPDVLSHIGTAREIAAALKIPFIVPKTQSTFTSRTHLAISIQEPSICKRYCGQLIQGIKVGPSPLFIRQRLSACGIRSINNIVDITNYILLETGQPLHAFDYDRLKGNEIRVRVSGREEIQALDGKKYLLPEGIPVIADAEKPVAVAGIIGGEETAVNASTTTILLESAFFDPVSVRRASRKLEISTESSYRFERGADVENVIYASRRAVDLILTCAGGETTGWKDLYPDPYKPRSIELRTDRVNAILGTDVSHQVIVDILNRLSFELKQVTKSKTMVFTIPSSRADIKEEIDLVEEIARHNGYDTIPVRLFGETIDVNVLENSWQFKTRIRTLFNGVGLFEAYNYGILKAEDLHRMHFQPHGESNNIISVTNPISQDMTVLGSSLIPGLLNNARTNQDRNNTATRLYEIATVFRKNNNTTEESVHIACLLTGLRVKQLWSDESAFMEFRDMSGIISALLTQLHINAWRFVPDDVPFLQPGQSARILINDKETGVIGGIHPDICDYFGINTPVFIFECSLNDLKQASKKDAEFIPLRRFPAIKRDFSFSFLPSVTWEDIKQCARKAGGELIEDMYLFDKYRKIPGNSDRYGLSFTVILRSAKKTLADADADAIQIKIIKTLGKKLNAELRN